MAYSHFFEIPSSIAALRHQEEALHKADRMRKVSNSLQRYSRSREMPVWKGDRD